MNAGCAKTANGGSTRVFENLRFRSCGQTLDGIKGAAAIRWRRAVYGIAKLVKHHTQTVKKIRKVCCRMRACASILLARSGFVRNALS